MTKEKCNHPFIKEEWVEESAPYIGGERNPEGGYFINTCQKCGKVITQTPES